MALLLSASSIDEQEAAKLMEEMAEEVKAEEIACPKNNISKPSSTKNNGAVLRKTANPKDGAPKPASKGASRTVKKTNPPSSVPSVRPTVSGRSPLTSRRNPTQVSVIILVVCEVLNASVQSTLVYFWKINPRWKSVGCMLNCITRT